MSTDVIYPESKLMQCMPLDWLEDSHCTLTKPTARFCASCFPLCVLLTGSRADAREREPLLAGYAWSNGAVLLTPSLPLTDAQACINSMFVGYVPTCLADHAASASAILPYAQPNLSGMVDGTAVAVHRAVAPCMHIKHAG